MIPFNKPFIIGNELEYIRQAVSLGKLSGDGKFTKKCHALLEKKYNFSKVLLTTSCTDALEMAAILCNIGFGDEVIMPSYTFVSTANAFVLHGAKIVFADSSSDHPNIDPEQVEKLITSKTRVIVIVHYAGVACNMERILHLSQKHNLLIVEDAAQAIDSFYIFPDGTKKALGSIGHFGTFSFHETKNIISGEGGMLVVNDNRYFERAEIIREKGTNRSAFFRGEVNKYEWMDLGSSFLPSEIISAFLYAQLKNIKKIQKKRIKIWENYYINLKPIEDSKKITLPKIPKYATNNAHIFYLLCKDLKERSDLIKHLGKNNIQSVFHYSSLNNSHFFAKKEQKYHTPNSDYYTTCLLRLPLFFDLQKKENNKIIDSILNFFQ